MKSMDSLDAAWDRLAGRIAARELTSPEEVTAALEPAGLLDDPDALTRAAGVLDRFWSEVHRDPRRAFGLATVAGAIATQLDGAPLLRSELTLRRATALFALGRARDAVRLLEDGLAELKRIDPAPTGELARARASLLGLVGKAQLGLGGIRRALVALEEAIAITRREGKPGELGGFLSTLGNARIHTGDARAAEEYYAEALRLARKHGSREGELVNLGNLGLVHHCLGESGLALGRYQEALELARELGDRRNAAGLEANLGLVRAEAGDLEGATRRYDAALLLAREQQDALTEVLALLRLAEVARERGALEEADRRVLEAGQLLEDVDDPRLSAVWRVQGRLLLARGEDHEARTVLRRALERARELSDRRGEGLALLDLARVEVACGELEAGRTLLEECAEVARDLEHADLRAWVELVLAELALDAGDAEAAEPHLTAAAGQAAVRHEAALGLVHARLAAMALAAREPARARAALVALEAKALGRGYRLIAGDIARQLATDPE